MRAYRFNAFENPPVGEAAFVEHRMYAVVEDDAGAASAAAQRQALEGWTLRPSGQDIDPPLGWEKGKLYPIGDIE